MEDESLKWMFSTALAVFGFSILANPKLKVGKSRILKWREFLIFLKNLISFLFGKINSYLCFYRFFWDLWSD
jgi:hypothetical protein